MTGRKASIAGIGIALLIFGASVSQAQNAEPANRPNVVIINADDVGYGDVSSYGATKIETPHIDRLARQGRRFTDAHTASAVCSPSRYALITGRYPSRKDFWRPLNLRDTLIVETERATVGTVMKRAGYATAIIGKWHLGFSNHYRVNWNEDLKPGPLELGFDYYFGVPVLNSHPPFVYVENHRVVGLTEEDPMVYGKTADTRYFPEKFGIDVIGGAEAAHERYDDRMVGTTLAEKAAAWIKEKSQAPSPFFLYFAPPQIHHPFTPAPRFIGTSEAGRYGDFMHELDWMVGEVMRVLEEEDLADNTLLIFTSDNGGMLNRGGQTAWEAGHRQNGELLGFKFDAWEGGHRVPFIARWPGRISAGTESDALISNVDLMATLAALVEQPLGEGEAPDSRDALPALVGPPSEEVREQLVVSPFQKKNLTLRKGKWVYISGQGGGGFTDPDVGDHMFGGPPTFPFTGQVNSDIEDGQVVEGAPPAQLYNLETDRAQRENLYRQRPEVAERMQRQLEEIVSNYDDED